MPRGVPKAKPDEAPEVEAEAPEGATASTEPDEAPEVAIEHRYETFEATRPDGVVVVVERNIDTGEQTVTEK